MLCKVNPNFLCNFLRSSPQKTTKKMSDRKAVIKNADMSEEMQQDAVDCATQALEKYNIEKVNFISYLVEIYFLEKKNEKKHSSF